MERLYELNRPPEDTEALLGAGGPRVGALLRGLCGGRAVPVAGRARAVGLAEALSLADLVDPAWVAGVEGRSDRARARLLDAGRGADLELALHMTMLLCTPCLDPADDEDVDAHAVSGALLWLACRLVGPALCGDPDREGLESLLADGWWPLGRVDGALVATAYRGPGTRALFAAPGPEAAHTRARTC
ncbi:hypothetical protein [Nocardiopsis dassonvillei]|uniref:hypothetical protein n=1 Tax=Nocardiopsis dassonvillei TaxID=2014 RepID=UPI00367015BF